jgi:hypothetical protein
LTIVIILTITILNLGIHYAQLNPA